MEKTKVGAVITFPEGISRQRVHKFLREWQADLDKDGSEFVFDSIQTGEYNPDWGGPVFYIP